MFLFHSLHQQFIKTTLLLLLQLLLLEATPKSTIPGLLKTVILALMAVKVAFHCPRQADLRSKFGVCGLALGSISCCDVETVKVLLENWFQWSPKEDIFEMEESDEADVGRKRSFGPCVFE